ncbi:MAG TPA: hypothetical protein VMW32_05740 [Bacteroidales bacterium]|nr:hypothetical protein [Bacteroidales bacterium]
MSEKEYNDELIKKILAELAKVKSILNSNYGKIANEVKKHSFKNPAQFTWSKNKNLEGRIDEILGRMSFGLRSQIQKASMTAWILASRKNDELVRKYLGSTYIDEEILSRYMKSNTDALNAFIRRTDSNQFNLSDRVWNLTQETKSQLKFHISQGIATGKPAAEISRDVRGILKEPDRLYRRVKKDGKLVLSKPAKAYKPGPGVYRSSYKNALRLTATEMNIAYRSSDHLRRQQLPFVMGVKVNLSGRHNVEDICDYNKGTYPVGFRFVGWHPHCYKEGTEVFTADGWKDFRDVEIGDDIWTLNPETKKLEISTAKSKVEYRYNGNLIRFHNRSLDLQVTPDHRMVYLNKVDGHIMDNKTAENYDHRKGGLYRSCNWTGSETQIINIGLYTIPIKLFAEFMGYYLSDGNVSKRRFAFNVAQQKGTNDDKREKMMECFKQLPFEAHPRKIGFEFFDKSFYLYLKQFGKSPERYIPDEIKESSKETIRTFLDAFIMCDGMVREPKSFIGNRGNEFVGKNPDRTYYTTSKRLTDDLSELILKIGKRPSFNLQDNRGPHKFRNGIYNINHIVWIIRECVSQTATVFKKEEIPYKGMVYDIGVEKNHTLYVRYNGKCVWSSNCLCYTTSVLMKKEKFLNYLRTGKMDERLLVKKIPIKAERYMKSMKGVIQGRKSKPYWLENFDKDMNLKPSIGQARSDVELYKKLPLDKGVVNKKQTPYQKAG